MVYDYDYYDDENGDSNGGVDGTDDEKRESSRIEGADCLQGAEGQNAPGVTNDKLQMSTKISDGGETDDGDETYYHDHADDDNDDHVDDAKIAKIVRITATFPSLNKEKQQRESLLARI